MLFGEKAMAEANKAKKVTIWKFFMVTLGSINQQRVECERCFD
jgi:hypothetical protein